MERGGVIHAGVLHCELRRDEVSGLRLTWTMTAGVDSADEGGTAAPGFVLKGLR